MKRALSPEQVAELRKHFKEHPRANYAAMARELSVNSETIRAALFGHGAYARITEPPVLVRVPRTRASTVPDKLATQVLELSKGGASVLEIMEKLGLGAPSVRDIILRRREAS